MFYSKLIAGGTEPGLRDLFGLKTVINNNMRWNSRELYRSGELPRESQANWLLESQIALEQSISHFVADVAGSLTTRDEAIIFGAGNCLDIPLDRLVTQFGMVSLVDMDSYAMNRAFGSLGTSVPENMRGIIDDASGGTVDFQFDGADRLAGPLCTVMDRLTGLIALYKNLPGHLNRLDYPSRSASLVISSMTANNFLAGRFFVQELLEKKGIDENADTIRKMKELVEVIEKAERVVINYHVKEMSRIAARDGRLILVLPEVDSLSMEIDDSWSRDERQARISRWSDSLQSSPQPSPLMEHLKRLSSITVIEDRHWVLFYYVPPKGKDGFANFKIVRGVAARPSA